MPSPEDVDILGVSCTYSLIAPILLLCAMVEAQLPSFELSISPLDVAIEHENFLPGIDTLVGISGRDQGLLALSAESATFNKKVCATTIIIETFLLIVSSNR